MNRASALRQKVAAGDTTITPTQLANATAADELDELRGTAAERQRQAHAQADAAQRERQAAEDAKTERAAMISELVTKYDGAVAAIAELARPEYHDSQRITLRLVAEAVWAGLLQGGHGYADASPILNAARALAGDRFIDAWRESVTDDDDSTSRVSESTHAS